MDKLLIVAATSDLGKSYINFINNDSILIDVIVRNPSKLENLERFNNVYNLDLNELGEISKLKLTSNYSKIIFFQGIDIIKPFNLYDINDITKTFNVNIISIILLLKNLVYNKNIKIGASIVIISSISGVSKGTQGHVLYSSSKAALLGLVKSLSLELSKRKTRINCISPGLIETDSLFNKNNHILTEQQKNEYFKKYPLGIGDINSINGTIKFLLGDSSSWITGQNFIVDGGNSNI